jgi:hypothetical protein
MVNSSDQEGGFLGIKRQVVQDAMAAFVLANLCFVAGYYELVHATDRDYFKDLPLTHSMLLALGANVLLFSLVGWGVACWVRRTANPFLHLAARVVLCGAVLVGLNSVRTTLAKTGVTFLALTDAALALKIVLAAVVLGGACLTVFKPARAAAMAKVVLAILFPLAMLDFGSLCWRFLKPVPVPPPSPGAPFLDPDVAGAQPRVVWIIFDALDPRAAFSHRSAGLELPELDRLRGESIDATNAFAPGPNTIISIPAMTTGRYVLEGLPAGPDLLDIRFAGARECVSWTAQSNVFSDVRAMGRNVGIAGWYHPYARLFPGVASATCSSAAAFKDCIRSATFFGNMANQILAIPGNLLMRWQHFRRHQENVAQARLLLRDGRLGLVFWHALVPHNPAACDPRTHRFMLSPPSETDGYLDNLKVVDQLVGVARRELERTGLSDRTWLIVSADHGWALAEQIYGGPDRHVPFFVKPPGTNACITCGLPFNTIASRGLILAILRGQVRKGPEVVTWLASHPTAPAPYDKMQKKPSSEPESALE